MGRLSNGRRSRKAGLPPGSLVFLGDRKVDKVRITLVDYDEERLVEKEAGSVEECFPYRDKPSVTWINIDGLHQVDVIEKFGRHFGLHSLVLEDILHTGQRPKMEDFKDYLFIVLQMIYLDAAKTEINAEQVSLILGPNYVLSFQETVGDVFDPVRERIRTARGRIRKMGADYLAYALMDAVVDNYFVVLEKVGEKVEELEEQIVGNTTPKLLRDINGLKRELLFLRRSVWPLREVISCLMRGESPLFAQTNIVYLRDVYDHTIQVIDSAETFRDMTAGMLDIYLSSTSNRMNEIMKFLTIMSTIFIPLSFIAGVYGMNFRVMPELEKTWGYPAILAVMTAVGAGMVLYFRKRKWF